MEGIYLSSASYLLLAALALLVLGLVGDQLMKRRRTKVETINSAPKAVVISAPGPKPWPVVGSLHLLGGYEIPYQAFDNLATKYGPAFSIKLGQVQCLVLSSLDNIREVLYTKGDQFDSRPNFCRFNQLFGGDKENSLAFCDWSDKHKLRREMLRDHTFPRAFTSRFYKLDELLNDELNILCQQLKNGATNVKPLVLQSCANVFLSYFCSTRFLSTDSKFVQIVRNFDEIFYEVNQGYAADFLPWLFPLHASNMRKMLGWSHEIRNFMMSEIVDQRMRDWVPNTEPEDYLGALVEEIKIDKSKMPLEMAFFALEDIVGGHSAVGNLLVKILGFVAQYPEVQTKMQQEVDNIAPGRNITLADRPMMPYTESVILESIRHICSPIVPHVANQTSVVAGYTIEKDTLIFLNNYTLNMSPKLWTSPEAFAPERFLSADRRIVKPEHFLPFGGGRRSCMGYKMTQFVSFATLATLMQRFHIRPLDNYKVPRGNLALPHNTFQLRFLPR